MTSLFCMASQAQDVKEWALVEPQSGRTVLMKTVGFLLASDADNTFAVVCTNGSIIDGARSVSFTQVDPAVIVSPENDGPVAQLSGSVDGELRLTGCAAGTLVTVSDSGGRPVRQSVAGGGVTTVDVSGLVPGVYILRAGSVKVKFIKR